MRDPTSTDPELYKVIFENDRVRVLEYRDQPGDRTAPHRHPDSVMYTLTSFRRRIASGDQQVEVELPAGQVRWLDAQEHAGRTSATRRRTRSSSNSRTTPLRCVPARA